MRYQNAFDQRTKHFIEPDSKISKMNLKSLFSALVTVLIAIALFISQFSAIRVQGQEVETIPDQRQQVSCGSVITGTVTLSGNLNCNHDGLIIGEASTTINLNGFRIRGPGIDNSKIGIAVSEDNVKIVGPGVISGFQAGILLINTDESAASSNNIQGSQKGIFLDSQSAENTVQMNMVRYNIVGLDNANGLAPVSNKNTFSTNICGTSSPSGLCTGN